MTNKAASAIKVTIRELMMSSNILGQLAHGVALPPKAKYWVGRFYDESQQLINAFNAENHERIKKYGQKVLMTVVNNQQQFAPLPEGYKPTLGENVQWRVKEEFDEVYQEEYKKAVEKHAAFPDKFHKVKLFEALGDEKVQVNIGSLHWMIADAPEKMD